MISRQKVKNSALLGGLVLSAGLVVGWYGLLAEVAEEGGRVVGALAPTTLPPEVYTVSV